MYCFGISLAKKERKALASIEERVEGLISEEVEKLGYELYDVQYAKEGKDYYSSLKKTA